MFGLKKDITTFSDEGLMQLLSSRRCNEALTELHARYSKKVLGFFIRMTRGDEEKSQDLVQDVFLRILEKHHLFDPSKRFYTWMFTIASNMVKTSFRSQQHDDLEEGSKVFELHTEFSDNRLDKEVFRNTLKGAVENLEEHHRIAFVLRFMEEMSVKEIAEILQVNEGTVKSRIFYATKKITLALNEFTPEKGEQHFKLH
ncbi:MAG: sigma-70 family RNA polymerase sigma factor [Bacteroidota bacterium]